MEETLALGASLGRVWRGSLTLGLVGALGAGKTHLVKGMADGNSVAKECVVTSPTFTLVHEYTGRLTLFHLDAYRLSGPAELLALGFDDFADETSVVVVEWADKVRAVMPKAMVWIDIVASAENARSFHVTATGSGAVRCLRDWQRAWR